LNKWLQKVHAPGNYGYPMVPRTEADISRCAVEVDLEKKTALGNMLQEVARSLQSKNKQLFEQLDLRSRHDNAESKHKEELESVVQKITNRSATLRKAELQAGL